MASVVNTFNKFASLEVFLVLSDIFSFVFQNIYKTIKKYILDPMIDPYFPDEKLDKMIIKLPILNKSEIKYGYFFIDMIKNVALIYLTYIVYKCVRKYKNQKI